MLVLAWTGLENSIDNLEMFLNFPTGSIHDVITLFILLVMIFFIVKSGGMSAPAIFILYVAVMGILNFIGVNSVFNIITLILDTAVEAIF